MAEDRNESCLTLVPSHSSLVTTKIQSSWNSPCAIKNFPPSILLRIAALLDGVSAFCLKYTNARLYAAIDVDRTKFNNCMRWLLNFRIANGIPASS